VLAKLGELVAFKKQTKGEKFTVITSGKGNVVHVHNIDKLQLVVDSDTLPLLSSATLDKALRKITRPLAPGRVESAEISYEGAAEPVAVISSSEREYFKPRREPTHEVTVEGTLESLNKGARSETFRSTSGEAITYKYMGKSRDELYAAFRHTATVRARGLGEVGQEGHLKRIYIYDLELLQPRKG
jgi:hypothetical protein